MVGRKEGRQDMALRKPLSFWGAAAALPLALLAVAGPVCGQSVEIGPRVGLTASTIRFQEPNANGQTKLKTGFHLGVGVAKPLFWHLEMEGSVLFVQGGFRGRGGHPATLGTAHLELPVILRIRGPWRVSPHVTAGLAGRVLLRCDLSEVGIVGTAPCDDPVVGTEWRRFDLSAVGGGGAGWDVGRGTVLVEGLMHWGLADVKRGSLPPGWAKTADLRISILFRVPVR
jgi:hypothetical protein